MLHQHPVFEPKIAGVGHEVVAPISVAGFEPARRFFAERFAELDPAVEALLVVHLDAQARLLHLARYDGDAVSLTIPLRAILLDAVHHATAGLIVAHNHPSGDPTPSATDLAATRRLPT